MIPAKDTKPAEELVKKPEMTHATLLMFILCVEAFFGAIPLGLIFIKPFFLTTMQTIYFGGCVVAALGMGIGVLLNNYKIKRVF